MHLTPAEFERVDIRVGTIREAVQPEGDTDFSALRSKIAVIVQTLRQPAIIKEVGAGISPIITLPEVGLFRFCILAIRSSTVSNGPEVPQDHQKKRLLSLVNLSCEVGLCLAG